VLALCALFLIYMAAWMMIHSEPDNIAGDVILDMALASVAIWVGGHTIQHWREIRAAARARPLDSNRDTTVSRQLTHYPATQQPEQDAHSQR
jgi:hypothetical protein